MANDLKLALAVTLDEKATLKNLSKAIKALQKHPGLFRINLKLNVDNKLTKTLTAMVRTVWKLNESIVGTLGSQKQMNGLIIAATSQIERQTEAINRQTEVLLRNRTANKQAQSAAGSTTGTPPSTAILGVSFLDIAKNVATAALMLKFLNETGTTVSEKLSERFGVWARSLGYTTNTVKVLTYAVKGLLLAASGIGISLLVTGITMGVNALFNHFAKAKQEQRALAAEHEKLAASWMSNKDAINALLNEKKSLNAEDERQLEIANELNKLMPNLITRVDANGQAHLKSAEAIAAELQYAEKLAKIDLERDMLNVDKSFDASRKGIDAKKTQLQGIQDKLETGLNTGKSKPGGIAAQSARKLKEKELLELGTEAAQLEREISNSVESMKESFDSLVERALALNDVELTDGISAEIGRISDEILESGLSGAELKKQAANLADFFSQIELLKTTTQNADTSAIRDEINRLGAALGYTESEIKSFIRAQTTQEQQEKKLATVSEFYTSQLFDQKAKIDSLKQAYAALESGQGMTLDQTMALVAQHPQLISALETENGILTLNKNAVYLLMKAKEREFKSSLEMRKKDLESSKKAFTAKLGMFSGEVIALESLDKAKFVLAGMPGDYLERAKMFDEYKAIIDEIKGIDAALQTDFTKVDPAPKPDGGGPGIEEDPEEEAYRSALSKFESVSERKFWSAQERIAGYERIRKAHANFLKRSTEDLEDILSKQAQLEDQAYQEKIDKHQKVYDQFAKDIAASERKQSNYVVGSKEWESELDKQLQKRKEWQNKLESNNRTLRSLLKNVDEASPAYQTLTAAIEENSEAWWTLNDEMGETKVEKITGQIESREKANERFANDITASERKQMRYMEEGNPEWEAEEQKQIFTRKAWQNQLHKDNEAMRKQLATLKETEPEFADLTAAIKANSDKWWELEKSIIGATTSMSDMHSDQMKKELEKIRDLELEAIEDVMEAEDDRHKSRMEKLEDETTKMKRYFSDQRKLLERENGVEDFTKEQNKLQDDEQEIRRKINVLALDNSREGLFKKQQLEQELADKLLEIEELSTQRTRELQQNELDDLEEATDRRIEDDKEAENDIYEYNKKNLERIKQETSEFWEEKLAEENLHLQNQKRLIDEHLKDVQSSVNAFAVGASTISQALANSLSNSLSKLQTGPGTEALTKAAERLEAWQEYKENKRKAEEIGAKGAGFADLKARNTKLREEYGFPDLKYDDLKHIPFFHQGGEVGVIGTSSGKFLNKLKSRLKQDEVLSVLRKGEVVLDQPLRFLRDYTRMLAGNLVPAMPAASASGVGHTYVTVQHVEVTGGQAGADAFFAAIERGKKTRR